jgi:hypothetical protein
MEGRTPTAIVRFKAPERSCEATGMLERTSGIAGTQGRQPASTQAPAAPRQASTQAGQHPGARTVVSVGARPMQANGQGAAQPCLIGCAYSRSATAGSGSDGCDGHARETGQDAGAASAECDAGAAAPCPCWAAARFWLSNGHTLRASGGGLVNWPLALELTDRLNPRAIA